MSKFLYVSGILALALAISGVGQTPPKKTAFDKAFLEMYARHVWAIGTDLKVSIGDPTPSSDLPGFKEVTVRISNDQASQDLKLLVSNDGVKVIAGNVYDVGSNPFKKDLDKVKTAGKPSFGTPGATVVILEFGDMQCPVCKTEAKMIRDHLVQEYPTQVRFYFADFPLDSIHTWARLASIGGRCVFRQNPAKFWDYFDWAYDHQESLSKENLKDRVMEWAGGQKDIDSLQLSRCLDQRLTEKEIDATVEEGKNLQVDGTPTLFINGRRSGATEWPDLKRIIDTEIAYQAVAKDAGEDCGCEVKLPAPGLPSTASPAIPSLIKKK